MGNNDFSYFSRLGRSTSSAPNSGGTQPEQDIEQNQQVTFSGRSMISTRLPESETFLICHEQLIHNEQTTFTDLEISPPSITYSPTDDPDKLFLASMHESRAVNPRASTNANVTSSTITSSTAEHSPETDDLENPRLAAFIADQPAIQSSGRFVSAITNPPEDPFAALASYESTSSFEDPSSFEEPIRSGGNDRLRLYNSGFGIFDDFRDTFPEEEAKPIISRPSKQATPAAIRDSSTPEISSEGQLGANTEAALRTATEKTTEQTSRVSGSFLEDLLEDLLVELKQTQQASHQDDPPAKVSASSQQRASVPVSNASIMANSDIPLIQMSPLVGAQIYPPLPQSVVVRIPLQPLQLQAIRVRVPQPQLQQTVRVQIPQPQPQFQQTVRVQIPQPQPQLQQTLRVRIPQPQLQQTVRVHIPQPQPQLQQTVRVQVPQPQLQQAVRVQVPPSSQFQQLLRPQPHQMGAYSGNSEVAPHSTPQIIPKIGRPRKRMKRSTDKWIIRDDLKGRPFKCGYHGCGRTYKSSGHLRAHFFEHTRISEHRCTYPECGPKRYFRGSSDLQRHINKHHVNIIRWSCAHCRQKFQSPESLKNHVLSQHPVNPQ